MSMIELMFWITNLLVSIVVGAFLGSEWGPVAGVFSGAAAFGVMLFAWRALHCALDLYYRVRPLRPVCRNGCCSQDDYMLIEWDDHENVWKCKCGDFYIEKGGVFHILMAEGQVVPYMERTMLRGWQPPSVP